MKKTRKRRSPRLASTRATSTRPTDEELELSCPTYSDNSTILERNHSLNVNAVSNSNNSTTLKRSHSVNIPNVVSNNNSTKLNRSQSLNGNNKTKKSFKSNSVDPVVLQRIEKN